MGTEIACGFSIARVEAVSGNIEIWREKRKEIPLAHEDYINLARNMIENTVSRRECILNELSTKNLDRH